MPQADLLTWPDLHPAELAAQQARVRWLEAKAAWETAPRSWRRVREVEMHRAAGESLNADIALQTARRAAGVE